MLLFGLNAHRPTLIFLKVSMYSKAFFNLSEWRTTIEEFAKYLYLWACIIALRQSDILSSKALITDESIFERRLCELSFVLLQ